MDRKHIINDPEIGNKAEAYEAFDDIPTNPNLEATIGDVINTRYGRRDMLRGMLGVSAAASLFGTSALIAPNRATAATAGTTAHLESKPPLASHPPARSDLLEKKLESSGSPLLQSHQIS